jgi:hypothetical protein
MFFVGTIMNDETIADFTEKHFRTALKASIMATVTMMAVVIFTDSYWKATWIGFWVLVLSLFSTWRRYLEPLCFVAFVLAEIFTCVDPAVLTKMQLALVR